MSTSELILFEPQRIQSYAFSESNFGESALQNEHAFFENDHFYTNPSADFAEIRFDHYDSYFE